MEDLGLKLNDFRKEYREIFAISVSEIEKRIAEIKPENANNIFNIYEKNSDGYNWQTTVIKMFDEDICKEIYRKWNELLLHRKNFSCEGCATCCNLACSEFSYEELKEKAKNGDNFATQFTKIFIPYNTKEEARKIYPEYIELLEQTGNENVYFYHCPKLTADNRCSDYENRPQICRDFPDNPLVILPKKCGFQQWKKDVEPVALMLHAMLNIVAHYREKIISAQK